jgi:hypothetical protein
VPAPLTVTLAFTGASGSPRGLRLLECLLAAGTGVAHAPGPRQGERRPPPDASKA